MNDKYIEGQFQKIGLYIKNNKPLNEYPDFVRLKFHFVNGESNYLNLSNKQLNAIYKILISE